jgi:hypothetical protein
MKPVAWMFVGLVIVAIGVLFDGGAARGLASTRTKLFETPPALYGPDVENSPTWKFTAA